MSYKNRQKAGEYSSKSIKEQIHKERNYAKKEIKQALQEEHEGDDYRYHINNKTKNEEASLKGAIKSAESRLSYYERALALYEDSWYNRYVNRIKSDIKSLKEKLLNWKEKK